MKPEFFKKTLDDTLSKIKHSLGVKAMEYVRNNNAMHNFEEGARIENTTREKIIHSFALKHMISIADIRNDIAAGYLPQVEVVDEKYNDAINYLILEKASVMDRIENNKNKRVDDY
jgi:hypothetical protein